MRYVPMDSLTEGMIVARNLYDANQNLLLKEGSEVKNAYKDKLKSMGLQGIYINDEFSNDIEVKDVISETVRLKALQTVKNVFIYPEQNSNNNKKSSLDDAKDILTKIIEDILENKDTMINLVDLKIFDDYTYFHCVNVAVLSIVVGMACGLNNAQLNDLGLGAFLHDIGKMFVHKKILNKNGRLDTDEFEHIKKHPEFGYQYLKKTFKIPAPAYVAVLQHHERYNGTGYPHQKSKEGISLYGRIICIADVYDALISNRTYRGALLPSEAMEYIMANGGTIFDPKLVQIFVTKVAPFPIGTMVNLSNGCKGIVIENFEKFCMRPKIKVVEKDNKIIQDPFIVDLSDLSDNRNVTIIN